MRSSCAPRDLRPAPASCATAPPPPPPRCRRVRRAARHPPTRLPTSPPSRRAPRPRLPRQALNTKHGRASGRILVTEERPRVGGNITTVSARGHRPTPQLRPCNPCNPWNPCNPFQHPPKPAQNDEGYLWEEGPNSFQPSMPILRMAVDSGLKDELVFGDPNAPRFVWWEGRLRPVPGGPLDLPVFDLMSIFGKIRAGLGAIGIKDPAPDYEESVEQFVRRNLVRGRRWMQPPHAHACAACMIKASSGRGRRVRTRRARRCSSA